MKKFKVEISKWLNKYNLIRKQESEMLLREELHKEGFSILSIIEVVDVKISKNNFLFEINKNWLIQKWTIVSNDIFKAYLKIKDELKYDLVYIYNDENTTLEEKQKIIHEIKEQYRIYLTTNKKDINKKEILEEKQKSIEENIDNFQMKKELDETYKIIDKVLVKINYFLNQENDEYLTFEKKEKLKEIYYVVIRLKSSTNISKLRQVWELALTKIWELEIQILENKKSQEYESLVLETNKLLREVWSKKTFIQKEKDVGYILTNFVKNIKDVFEVWKTKETKIEIDTKSGSYLKTKILIEKYEEKLKEINKEIIKNFIIYIIPNQKNEEQKTNYFLRKKVIKQNLMIFKAKLTGKSFSYTKIVKWYDYFLGKFINLLQFFTLPIFIIILIYSFVFLLLNLLNYFKLFELNLNFNWVFYFIHIYLAFILLSKIKWFLSLSFSVVIFSFFIIFGVINF